MYYTSFIFVDTKQCMMTCVLEGNIFLKCKYIKLYPMTCIVGDKHDWNVDKPQKNSCVYDVYMVVVVSS